MYRYTVYMQVCPEGWDMVHSSCYQTLSGQVAQSTGRANCQDAGGHLALMTTAEETSAIQAYLLTKGLTEVYGWIDGTDAATDGVWLAESGEELPYIGFTGLEPNGRVAENCLVVGISQVIDITCNGNSYVQYTLCEN